MVIFVLNKTSQNGIHLRIFAKCRVTMKLNTKMFTILKNQATHNHEDDEEEIKAGKFRRKIKKQVEKIRQNFCKTFTMKKSKKLSQKKETSNKTFTLQVPATSTKSQKFPNFAYTCTMEGNLEWWKIFVEIRWTKWIVLFSTNEVLKILASCEDILGHGTFKSCPPQIEQPKVLLGKSKQLSRTNGI